MFSNTMHKYCCWCHDGGVDWKCNPPPRKWLLMEPHPDSYTGKRSAPAPDPINKFTILTYNILARKLATKQAFEHSHVKHLTWTYRRNLILTELKRYDPSIISLQGVDGEQFERFLQPKLRDLGYSGIFAIKTTRDSVAFSPHGVGEMIPDSCATFYKDSSFHLVHRKVVHFGEVIKETFHSSNDLLSKASAQENIALLSLLGAKEGPPSDSKLGSNSNVRLNCPILVCNTQLTPGSSSTDVRLVQAIILMREIEGFANKYGCGDVSGTPGDRVHLILCGDLGSSPGSGVTDFLQLGRVPVNHPDFRSTNQSDRLEKLCEVKKEGSELYFVHPFRIRSVYLTAAGNKLPFTTFTEGVKDIHDYIYHGVPRVVPIGVLGPLEPHWLSRRKYKGAPNHCIPSSHLPLLAEFKIIETRKSFAKLHESKSVKSGLTSYLNSIFWISSS